MFPEPVRAAEAWGDALPGSGPAATDLRFSDFFEMPVGPKGLRYTETARRMEGRRVRIVGFMVRQDQPTPGIFLLAPFPLQVQESESKQADDLPATTVHVFVPRDRDRIVPFTPGPLRLTGTLALGPR
ncbi:MAG TPA: hypothetical protein VKF62_06350, partial [Planctomycetota bacterium]|nr:hypothetical protein [Planctomycetota bacterium]